MKKDIKEFVPKHKLDNSNIDELLLLEDLEIDLITTELLNWFKDMSQPIATELIEVLLKNPNSLKKHVTIILDNERADSILKYNILAYLLNNLDIKDLKHFEKSLKRIVDKPAKYEVYYEVSKYAEELLKKI